MDLYSDSISEKFLFLFENNFVLDFVRDIKLSLPLQA